MTPTYMPLTSTQLLILQVEYSEARDNIPLPLPFKFLKVNIKLFNITFDYIFNSMVHTRH